ncbi:ATP synthase B chain [Methanosarcina mazei TMA]|uniref:F0F1 ATP synthase subunit B family protein n=1 Tax=Methanosarcina mazei TaxID=2209 RepID=UPI0006D439E4|nr:ATP synthase subunit B [Methanosarcina mazei]UWJ23816.1 ATP synthase B chain [Methanosarcina mazei TMA]BBL64591.1 ATP synthase subunit B [Methanosarcina mazei]
MLIDWFTVVAQVVNFLILVWLLKHFLYKPILNAVDAREKKVADELKNADAKEAEAQKEKEEFKHKNEDFDQQRNALLNKAKEEAKAKRQQLFEEVRKDASDLRAKQQEALRNDEQNLSQEIGRRTQQEVFNIARKVLTDMAGTSLEERAVDVFAQRLRNLKDEEKKQLASALSASSSQMLIRTAFDLPQAQRDSIKKTIKETLGIETQPKFETAPDLVSGIELTTDGQKVAWSIANYLTLMQKSIDEKLKEQFKGKVETEPQTKNNKPKLERESETEQEPEAETNKPKSKTEESEVETKPETDYNKPKSRKEPEAEQEPDAKQEPEARQESGTKSESVAKQ